MKKVIYLAGPINDCTDAQAYDWRNEVKQQLCEKFDFLDPMARDYRGQEAMAFKEIVQGDMNDIEASHIVLAYCPFPSVGTSMEIFYASHTLGKRVLCVAREHPSPWLVRFSERVFVSLGEAVEALRIEV